MRGDATGAPQLARRPAVMSPMRLLLALLASLAVAAPAGAATVSARVEPGVCGGHGPCQPATLVVTFAAAPGEANALGVRADATGVEVADTGAPPAAGPGCERRPERVVVCGRPPGAEVRLEGDLGDRDDTAELPLRGLLRAGPGDDRVAATGRGAMVVGDEGDDVLSGGGEAQTLVGGAGRDVLSGGAGDEVSYDGRMAPVIVDLADPGPDGAVGEGDVISGVEGATGGEAGDRLVAGPTAAHLLGGAGPDLLLGAGGRDTILADEGDDRIDAGPGADVVDDGLGADRVVLGPGNDRVEVGGGRDRVDAGPGDDLIRPGFRAGVLDVACGSGRDTITDPGRGTPLRAGCERVVWSAIAVALPARGALLRLSPMQEPGEAWHATLTAIRDGAVLARRSFGAPRRAAPLRLSGRGRRLVRRRGSVRARLVLRLTQAGEELERHSIVLVVRRR
jgi:hypothetical protein